MQMTKLAGVLDAEANVVDLAQDHSNAELDAACSPFLDHDVLIVCEQSALTPHEHI